LKPFTLPPLAKLRRRSSPIASGGLEPHQARVVEVRELLRDAPPLRGGDVAQSLGGDGGEQVLVDALVDGPALQLLLLYGWPPAG
jgi:hypothetical protein